MKLLKMVLVRIFWCGKEQTGEQLSPRSRGYMPDANSATGTIYVARVTRKPCYRRENRAMPL